MPDSMTMAEYKARHLKRVERRAKYLQTLTPKQRRIRDDHVSYVRWWKTEYKKLSKTIHGIKTFVHGQGHNNLDSLKTATRGLNKRRLEARTMMHARMAAYVDYQLKMEDASDGERPLARQDAA